MGCDLVCSHWSVSDGPHGLSRAVQATGCTLAQSALTSCYDVMS